MNKIINKLFKFLFATFLGAMFLFVFVRVWTNFPAYPRTKLILSDTQVALDQSPGIWATFNWGNTFIYFTTLSNIIAIVLIFIEWASFGKIRIPKKAKSAALLYMIITGVVFWTSIAPFLPWGHDWFFDLDCIEAHLIVLLAAIWFWLSDKRKVKVTFKDYLYMLVYPILYLIMSTAIYFATPGHIAVYPFIDFYDWFALGLPRWASLLVTSLFLVFLLAIFIFSYWVLSKIDNKINAKEKTL